MVGTAEAEAEAALQKLGAALKQPEGNKLGKIKHLFHRSYM